MWQHRRVINAQELIGKKLLRVTTSWHQFPDAEPSLLHMWLHLDDLGIVRFHTPDDGLDLRLDEPHEPYDMDEYGHVTVEDDSPAFPVSRFISQRIVDVREVWHLGIGRSVGLVLCFATGNIRVLNLADELVLSLDDSLGPAEAELREVTLSS